MRKSLLSILFVLVLTGLACNLSGTETEVGVDATPAGNTDPATPTLVVTSASDPTPIPLDDPTAVPTAEPAPAGTGIIQQLGGSILTLAVQGDIAYVGVGPRLATIDISDARNPQWIATSEPFPELVTAVIVHGETAYVALDGLGLATFDVSDPTNLVLLNHTAEFNGYGTFHDLVLAGETLYLLNGQSYDDIDQALLAIDVSDPAGATLISQHTLSEAALYLGHANHTLFIQHRTDIALLNATDPANLQPLGRVFAQSGDNYLTGFTIAQGQAYLASANGLQIYDISSPTEPTLLSTSTSEDFFPTGGIAVEGNFVYTYFSFGEFGYCETTFITHDFNDLNNPTVSEPVRASSCSGQVVVQDFHLYANGWEGLSIFRIDNGVPLAESTLVDVSGLDSAGLLSEDGQRVYISSGNSVSVLDSTTPQNPVQLGTMPLDGTTGFFEGQGNVLYTASFNVGMRVFDITDFQNPQELITYQDTFGPSGQFFLVDGHLYLSDEEVKGWDVSDPAAPVRTLTVALDEPYGHFVINVNQDHIFVAREKEGLGFIDILDHAGNLLQTLDLPGRPSNLTAVDQFLYITSGDCYNSDACENFFTIADISDMANPTSATMGSPLILSGIVVRGDYAYVASDEMGVLVIDVSDPTRPVEHEQINLPGFTRWVYEIGDVLYVPAGRAGLYILDPIE